MNYRVLIPAYCPDDSLITLCSELISSYKLIVVDDGGGDTYKGIFEKVAALGADVVTHSVNRGKGAAIKTGISYAKSLIEDGEAIDGIITADADGQHTAEDIAKVAKAMQDNPNKLVLGVRDLSKMPFRSRFGNSISLFFFNLSTGLKVTDTQTGLRGMPVNVFDKLLTVDGDRYEYEMNMLLALPAWKISVAEVKISTLYIDGNKSSHFNPIKDGLLVFSRVIKYAASSIISAVVDYLLYIVLLFFNLPVAVCYAGARVFSAAVNYSLNCKMVFKSKYSVKSAVCYFALAAFSLIIGSVATQALSLLISSVVAKLIMDCLLFAMNYFVQKKLIFAE